MAPPPTRPAAAPAPPAATRWAPSRRIAGFGADALMDQLDDPRMAPDDMPCVVFRELLFRAGTTALAPRTRGELATIARVLTAVSSHRIEVGSRLGPGRPMATDGLLRAERARIIRNELIALGIAPDRLVLETPDTFERLVEEINRSGGERAQSIGLCVRA